MGRNRQYLYILIDAMPHAHSVTKMTSFVYTKRYAEKCKKWREIILSKPTASDSVAQILGVFPSPSIALKAQRPQLNYHKDKIQLRSWGDAGISMA